MGIYYHFYAIPPTGIGAEAKREAEEYPDDVDDEEEAEYGPSPTKFAEESITLDKPFGHVYDFLYKNKAPEWAGVRLAVEGPPGQMGTESESFLLPSQVVRAADALQRVPAAAIEQLVRSQTDHPDSIQAVPPDFERLKEFYARAASRGHGVFISIG